MAIIGVASIRVRPDLTQFRRETNAELAKINVEFRVKVGADTDRFERQMRQLIARYEGKDVELDPTIQTRRVRKAEADIRKITGRIGSSFLSVGKTTVKTTSQIAAFSVAVGGLASSVSGTATLVGGLGSAIFSMGAAAAGVGIGGLAALAAGTATVKLATSGMGDAFKAVAEDDAKALQEALKNMAPAARSFVTETAKLKPIFDQLRLDTQTALFRGLGVEVLQTGRALQGTFTGLFVQIARQANAAAIDVLRFVREARTIKDLRAISSNIAGGFREVSAAARPIVQAIIDITKSATDLLPDMGRSIEDVARRFAAFVRVKADSGELTQFFRDGIEATKQFGRVLRDFGVGISNVFHIGSVAGGGFLGILERAAAGFRNFTESIGGQAILSDVFAIINDIAGAFGQFLGELKPLLPVLAELGRTLADSVITILRQLGPVLTQVGKAIGDALIETLPILVPVVVKLAEGIGRIVIAIAPLIPTLARVLEALTPLIDPFVRLVESILPPLITLIEELTPVIEFLARGLGLLLDVTSSVVRGLSNLGDVFDLIADPMDTVRKLIALNTGDPLGEFGGGIKKGFRRVGHEAITAIEEGLDGKKSSLLGTIGDAMDDLVNRATFGASTAEVSGMSFMEAVNRGIATQEGALKDTINRITSVVIGLLTGKQPDFQTQGMSLSRALGTGLTQGQQEVIDTVRNTVQRLLDALTGKKSSFEQEGRAIAQRLGGGISAGQQEAVNAAQRAANAVLGIFGGVSLFNEGASIMASLRNGLSAGVAAVRQVLTSMTSLIPQWKGPETVDRKLLVPAGEAIMLGLIKSIESQLPALRATLATVTGEVTGAFSTDPSVNARTVVRADLGGFDPTPVVVTIEANEGALTGFISGKIDANNRTIKRFGTVGASV